MAGTKSKKIAMSGGSSFTAVWISEALTQAGHSVTLLCPKAKNKYSGLPKKRLEVASKWATHEFNIPVENGQMANWIRKNRPSIWIHHHHFMENFRSPAYDQERAHQVGIAPLAEIVSALKESGCEGIIYSGSYFEANPNTPYAQSKRDVWNELVRQAHLNHIPLSKVVIPNPFGPLENDDRLIPVLIQKTQKKEPLTLSAPDSVGDQLPIQDLAQTYVDAVNQLPSSPQIYSPTGWVGTNAKWITLLNRALIQEELGLTPVEPQVPPVEKRAPVTRMANSFDQFEKQIQQSVWKHYASWYREFIMNE